MKKILPIIMALILAAIASVGIVQWSRSIKESHRVMDVVILDRTVDAGDTLTRDVLKTSTISYSDTSLAGGNSFWQFVLNDIADPKNIGSLDGRTVNREIKAGEPLLNSMLDPTKERRVVVDWKNKIEENTRAISIPVASNQAVSGLVQVGDRVDILVTLQVPEENKGEERTISMPVEMGTTVRNVNIPYSGDARTRPMTFYLKQDVEVLAVGIDTLTPEKATDLIDDPFAALTATKGQGSGVTVALSPDDVLMFAFAITAGESEFLLTLRRPGDHNIADLATIKPADFSKVLKAVGISEK